MDSQRIPFYIKGALIIIGLYFLIEMLYVARLILIPLLFSIVFAILLSPFVAFLQRLKINRIISISIAVTLPLALIITMIILLSFQFKMLTSNVPMILDQLDVALSGTVKWISETFNLNQDTLKNFISDSSNEFLKERKSSIGHTMSALGNGIVVSVIVPVYIFMILYYKPLILEFIQRMFKVQNRTDVNEVLHSTKSIIQHYLLALLIEVVVVAVLNSVGLLIIGLDYAILFGVISALLNLIPYIGVVVGMILPLMLSLATESLTTSLMIFLLFSFTQLIDNNYIHPKMVGSRVKINALASLIVVIAGGALWGISGMFLALPLTAIFKVICDHIESLKPYGLLLGDVMPTNSSSKRTSTKTK